MNAGPPAAPSATGSPPPAGGRRLTIVAPAGGGGIRQSAEDLAEALHALGVGAWLGDRAEANHPAHFHYGNASRSVLRQLARRRGDLVTVHDVVPRDRLLRLLLPPVVAPILARHHLVVHSRHAAGLLSGVVRAARPEVLPLLLAAPSDPGPSPLGPAPLGPASLGPAPLGPAPLGPAPVGPSPGPGRSGVTAVLAGRLRAVKGVAGLVEAAAARPGLRLVLVGRAADRATRNLLARLPPNVSHLDHPDHPTFLAALGAADVVVSWRPDSVGETSGPVVQAHQMGTPVAGLAVGSLPEYCGAGDVLVPAGTPPGGLLDAVLAAPLERIPAGDTRREDAASIAARYTVLYRRFGLLPGG